MHQKDLSKCWLDQHYNNKNSKLLGSDCTSASGYRSDLNEYTKIYITKSQRTKEDLVKELHALSFGLKLQLDFYHKAKLVDSLLRCKKCQGFESLEQHKSSRY